MATTVLMDDHVQNKHYHLVFTHKEMVMIDTHWNDEDKLLVGLMHTKAFEDCTRWSDLSPLQYQLLVSRNIAKLDELTEDQQMDENNETVKSLHFLITGLIKCLEGVTDANIDLLRIERISEEVVNFSHHASVSLQLGASKAPQSEKSSPFKIVVDNTK